MATRILVVSAEPGLLPLLEYVLGQAGHQVSTVADFAAAGTTLERVLPHLVVIDVDHPASDGTATARALRSRPGFAFVPFVFLSADDEVMQRLGDVAGGIDDYVAKPFDREELAARCEAALRRAESYRRVSRHDWVTELSNRDHFEHRLADEIYRQQRYGIFSALALVAVDVQAVEEVQARHGTAAADRMLRHVGRFLRDNVRALDVPTRYNETGFIVLMPHTTRDKAMIAIRRLRDALERARAELVEEPQPVPVRASFGVTVVDQSASDTSEMIHRAHASMMMARGQPGRTLFVWSDEARAPVPVDWPVDE